VLDRLTQVAGDVAISSVTWHELWFGTERSRLTKIGLSPSYPDGQIASIAAVNNLILVTRNVSDFIHFDGISVENWFD
jgi:tRNA(fMet)-specific endonuclease VapC